LRTRADHGRVFSSVLIVGGGLAAQRAAETLRARDHRGPIRVVCGEPIAPYDRPPLSKELRAEPFRPAGWYAEQDVELLLGRRAARLDVAARRVTLEDGAELGYDELIIATGSRPRRLPMFAGRANVHVLRTLADADGLRAALAPGARLAIIGAGFVGQEVAATARGLGVEVTLIEAAEVPLAHVLGLRLGGWFADLHRSEGVAVELGVSVTDARPAVAGAPVTQLVLSDGRTLPADAVLVGVGVVPDTRWLVGSPLAERVAVDEGARTLVPHVYAAGDVTRPALGARGAPGRGGRALDPRPAGGSRSARERVERPVRRPHPRRRRGRPRRRDRRPARGARLHRGAAPPRRRGRRPARRPPA
jgi:3-phenylpropionate/trans-cinnamate dioxygenase ferredoxin reductase subunit